jgi:hypothetical protein
MKNSLDDKWLATAMMPKPCILKFQTIWQQCILADKSKNPFCIQNPEYIQNQLIDDTAGAARVTINLSQDQNFSEK